MFPHVLQVPNVFPNGAPNSTTLLFHMACSKFYPSDLYRWDKGEHNIFFFQPFFLNEPIKMVHFKHEKPISPNTSRGGGGEDSKVPELFCDGSIKFGHSLIHVLCRSNSFS
jgi:hypothetical protein